MPATSVDVSADWARWMAANRDAIARLNILCGPRFIELTANFVRRFTHFGSAMRVDTDAAAFDAALHAAGAPGPERQPRAY